MATHEIKLIIVYGTNKPLDVKSDETIGVMKLAAMGLFGIPASEQNSYILRAKVEGTEEQLDEAKTVETYHLHTDQKVTLAAGTPFGQV
jgi:membrane protease subunit (stomatin/prohibitin family)